MTNFATSVSGTKKPFAQPDAIHVIIFHARRSLLTAAAADDPVASPARNRAVQRPARNEGKKFLLRSGWVEPRNAPMHEIKTSVGDAFDGSLILDITPHGCSVGNPGIVGIVDGGRHPIDVDGIHVT